MNSHTFLCSSCSTICRANSSILNCLSCKSPLFVTYSSQNTDIHDSKYCSGVNIPLPISHTDDFVSLGEGNTPLVRLNNINESLGVNITVKLESSNPTGSFKDRGTSMMLSMLKMDGARNIVEDSSGNAGASIAAYAAKAGIKAHIFTPSKAPQPKLDQIRVYGAILHIVDGTRDQTTEAAIAYQKKTKAVYASHNLNPYFIEGTKIFAYELYNELGGNLPSNIVMPVGNGSLYLGTWKGFMELKRKELIDDLPKLHCAQSMSVEPLTAAFMGNHWDQSMIKPTRASGIAVSLPPRQHQIIEAMRDSGGAAISVSEEEILDWQLKLSSKEGLFVEPTSATAFAGAIRLIKEGHINSNSTLLIPVTGSGLKDISPV